MEEIKVIIDLIKEAYNGAKDWLDKHTWGYYVVAVVITVAIILVAVFAPAVVASWNCFMAFIAPFAIIWFLIWNRRKKNEAVTSKPEPATKTKKKKKKIE